MEKLGNQHATNIDNLVTNNQLDGKEEAGGLSVEEIGEREGLLRFLEAFKDTGIYTLSKVHTQVACRKG